MDTLEFAFVGKHKVVHVVTNNNKIEISLSNAFVGGIVVGGIRRKNFFGRQIQKVKNWFR
jgi:hypothetical protein